MQNRRLPDIILLMATKSRNKKAKQTPSVLNKKAYLNYELTDRFEAGLALLGTEVKSLRAGQGDLNASYARVENDECWLVGCKIAQYAQAGGANHEPSRKKKILLHKGEIRKIGTKLDQRGFTLVPLRIYFNHRGLAKIELALARGKRQYDKRKAIADRTQRQDIDRSMKKYRR